MPASAAEGPSCAPLSLCGLGADHSAPNLSSQGLQNIAKTWDVTQLDIVPYKDKGHHRLR